MNILESHGSRRRLYKEVATSFENGASYAEDPAGQGRHRTGTEIPYQRDGEDRPVVVSRHRAAELLGVVDLANESPTVALIMDKRLRMYTTTKGVYLHDGEYRLIKIPEEG